jgi:hypothetical protein
LVFELRIFVGVVLVGKFGVERAPVVSASTTLGEGAVHAIAGLRAVLGKGTEREGAFGASHD